MIHDDGDEYEDSASGPDSRTRGPADLTPGPEGQRIGAAEPEGRRNGAPAPGRRIGPAGPEGRRSGDVQPGPTALSAPAGPDRTTGRPAVGVYLGQPAAGGKRRRNLEGRRGRVDGR